MTQLAMLPDGLTLSLMVDGVPVVVRYDERRSRVVAVVAYRGCQVSEEEGEAIRARLHPRVELVAYQRLYQMRRR